MNRSIVIFLLLGIILFPNYGQDISPKIAKKVANNFKVIVAPLEKDFFQYHFDPNKRKFGNRISTDTIIKEVIEGKFQGFTGYYLVKYINGGFIIVSGHRSRGPILGYSFINEFDNNNIPIALQYILNDYLKNLYRTKNNNQLNKSKIEEWMDIEQFNRSKIISRLLNSRLKKSGNSSGLYPDFFIATQWNQDRTYNNDCPGYNSHSNIPSYSGDDDWYYCYKCCAGCVAISTAQIMNFWNFSEGDEADFEWWQMPFPGLNSYDLDFDDEIESVAYLIARIGEEVDMDYCSDGGPASGAYHKCVFPYIGCQSDYDAESAFVKFGYSNNISFKLKASHTYNGWVDILADEIQAGRPVLYGVEGHSLIVDGYNSSNDNFHWNFGWGGFCDGYYDFEDLYFETANDTIDFTSIIKHDCLTNIYPDIDNNKIFNTNTVFESNSNKTYHVDDYIYAAYNSTDFIVEDDANCWLLAGNSITLSPGTHIETGGSLLAKILPVFSATKSSSKSSNYQKESQLINKEFVNNSFKLYPNPTIGIFWVEFENSNEIKKISVFDYYGRCIETRITSDNSIVFDLTNERKGVYIVQIKSNTFVINNRIVIL